MIRGKDATINGRNVLLKMDVHCSKNIVFYHVYRIYYQFHNNQNLPSKFGKCDENQTREGKMRQAICFSWPKAHSTLSHIPQVT